MAAVLDDNAHDVATRRDKDDAGTIVYSTIPVYMYRGIGLRPMENDIYLRNGVTAYGIVALGNTKFVYSIAAADRIWRRWYILAHIVAILIRIGEKLIMLTEHCNNAMLAANGSRTESEKVKDALQAHKDGHSKWNKVIGWGSLGLTGAGGSLAALKDVLKELLK